MKKNKPRSPIKANLTQADVRHLFDYDYENGWLIRKKDEHGRVVNRPCGHKPASHGYGRVWIDGKMYLAHRIIWLWHKGAWPQYEIDHIDRNPMNNRIENLRDVDHSKNTHNQGIRKNNTTGFPGVYKRNEKYVARIGDNGERIHLGYFNTSEEAFLAYMLGKIKYHPTSSDAQEYYRELHYAG